MDVLTLYESISSAYEVLSTFKGRLLELSMSDYNSENPKLFLGLLGRLADSLETRLFYDYLEQAKKFSSLPEPTEKPRELLELERSISVVLGTIGKFSEFLSVIDAARSHTIPWGLINQFERLSRVIVGDSRVIVSPTWQYNYLYFPIDSSLKNQINIIKNFDSDLYTALSSILKEFPRFYSLSFPSIQIENVLQLADWAHELGHFVDNFEGERATGKSQLYFSMEALKSNIRIQLSESEWTFLEQKLLQRQQSGKQFIALDKFTFRGIIISHLINILQNWAREIFADYFAIRLFGPAALFSLCDLALFYYPDINVSYDADHPSLRFRIKLMIEEIQRWSKTQNSDSVIEDWKNFLPLEEKSAFDNYVASLLKRTQIAAVEMDSDITSNVIEAKYVRGLISILEPRIADIAIIIQKAVDEYINNHISSNPPTKDCFLKPLDFKPIGGHINLLRQLIPPNPINQNNNSSIRDIIQLAIRLNAGWLHWNARHTYPKSISMNDFRKVKEDRIDIERLVMKSIELLEAEQWYTAHRKFDLEYENQIGHSNKANLAAIPNTSIQGGVLGKKTITDRLNSSINPIVITPLLDHLTQVDEASIDVRLGNEFIGTRHTRLHALDPADQGIGNQIAKYQEQYYVPFGYSFVLHPQQFVLGSTLEYISLPDDVCAIVVGRSSWGRLGLIIATASKVDPGFKGALTLELVNLGNVPIHVYPGSRIAQLVLYNVF